jgi:tetratricopeptide (TPR) repeat protein
MQQSQYELASDAAWEAVKFSEIRIRSKPGDSTMLAEARENYAILIECLTDLVARYPDQSVFLVKLVQAYQDRADLERLMAYHGAIGLIEEGLRHPEVKVSPELLYELARLKHVVGKSDEALELVGRVLEAAPDNVAAQKLHERLTQTEGEEAPKVDRPSSETGATPPEEG